MTACRMPSPTWTLRYGYNQALRWIHLQWHIEAWLSSSWAITGCGGNVNVLSADATTLDKHAGEHAGAINTVHCVYVTCSCA